jgi:fucose 4-O-acetylase-like acetyltransferase
MTEVHRPRRILRSLGAVFAGFVVVVVLSLRTDMALHASGVFLALVATALPCAWAGGRLRTLQLPDDRR